MEKKKLLLVAISVGVFLVLTIGAALLVFVPKNTPPEAIASQSNPGLTAVAPSPPIDTIEPGQANPNPSTVDAQSLLKNSGDVPGLRSPPDGTVRENDSFYVNGTSKPAETLISVTKPSTTAVPGTPGTTPVKAVTAPAQAPPKPAQTAPPVASAASPTVAPISTASVSQNKPPVVAPVSTASVSQNKAPVETKVYNDFWVQAGAFSSTVIAEGAKATLASKGIKSIIENREIGGQTLFRVRIGPYTSQNEADYWLSLVKSIDGFEDSQVRQTIR
jgi:DedD protein